MSRMCHDPWFMNDSTIAVYHGSVVTHDTLYMKKPLPYIVGQYGPMTWNECTNLGLLIAKRALVSMSTY